MSTTIPRAEIDAIYERHGQEPLPDLLHLGEPTTEWARAVAAAHRAFGPAPIAADLDALADRYEQEAS